MIDQNTSCDWIQYHWDLFGQASKHSLANKPTRINLAYKRNEPASRRYVCQTSITSNENHLKEAIDLFDTILAHDSNTQEEALSTESECSQDRICRNIQEIVQGSVNIQKPKNTHYDNHWI